MLPGLLYLFHLLFLVTTLCVVAHSRPLYGPTLGPDRRFLPSLFSFSQSVPVARAITILPPLRS